MLWLHEYKEFKIMAERLIEIGDSGNVFIKAELLKFQLNKISEKQCLNNLINILSNGEHFKPYSR